MSVNANPSTTVLHSFRMRTLENSNKIDVSVKIVTTAISLFMIFSFPLHFKDTNGNNRLIMVGLEWIPIAALLLIAEYARPILFDKYCAFLFETPGKGLVFIFVALEMLLETLQGYSRPEYADITFGCGITLLCFGVIMIVLGLFTRRPHENVEESNVGYTDLLVSPTEMDQNYGNDNHRRTCSLYFRFFFSSPAFFMIITAIFLLNSTKGAVGFDIICLVEVIIVSVLVIMTDYFRAEWVPKYASFIATYRGRFILYLYMGSFKLVSTSLNMVGMTIGVITAVSWCSLVGIILLMLSFKHEFPDALFTFEEVALPNYGI